MTKPKKTPRQLAEEHWDWIEEVLRNRMTETRHMFIEGFIHGHKHGSQRRNESANKTKSGR